MSIIIAVDNSLDNLTLLRLSTGRAMELDVTAVDPARLEGIAALARQIRKQASVHNPAANDPR